eukprot:CAMPEP_0174375052 /NCGR_PEP_ID=MMETSP0811_2-20130205/113108_1 /TAXON_ID=73025 ORGANISM="Eutreptiella gymnastica-like, Strain CCMP1594" /NCGR_SAMPLE_ID=MMETSP0811_2 /ASSEMBLY_ACC=CAM_ASM_000667 /LENGTH=95 /DNA_ID=CAMNT_0015524893 /DNA_START=12 /DNA_END=295 /DNA_ORIENTATION=+
MRGGDQRRQAHWVYGQLDVGGQELVGGPVPHIVLHRAVKVHELRAAQLNILSDEGGGRSFRVLLALPPLPRDDHGVGGQTLCRLRVVRDARWVDG